MCYLYRHKDGPLAPYLTLDVLIAMDVNGIVWTLNIILLIHILSFGNGAHRHVAFFTRCALWSHTSYGLHTCLDSIKRCWISRSDLSIGPVERLVGIGGGVVEAVGGRRGLAATGMGRGGYSAERGVKISVGGNRVLLVKGGQSATLSNVLIYWTIASIDWVGHHGRDCPLERCLALACGVV